MPIYSYAGTFVRKKKSNYREKKGHAGQIKRTASPPAKKNRRLAVQSVGQNLAQNRSYIGLAEKLGTGLDHC